MNRFPDLEQVLDGAKKNVIASDEELFSESSWTRLFMGFGAHTARTTTPSARRFQRPLPVQVISGIPGISPLKSCSSEMAGTRFENLNSAERGFSPDHRFPAGKADCRDNPGSWRPFPSPSRQKHGQITLGRHEKGPVCH